MERRARSVADLRIGPAAVLERQRAVEWRERTVQERADLFVELMRIWKADAPGFARSSRELDTDRHGNGDAVMTGE